jgi:hypothetical protein
VRWKRGRRGDRPVTVKAGTLGDDDEDELEADGEDVDEPDAEGVCDENDERSSGPTEKHT